MGEAPGGAPHPQLAVLVHRHVTGLEVLAPEEGSAVRTNMERRRSERGDSPCGPVLLSGCTGRWWGEESGQKETEVNSAAQRIRL